MTEITAPNLMLQNTMADIKTSNIQSMTTEMDQITMQVIPEEPNNTEVKRATAVSDDDLTANVLQSLMTKEEVGEALNPEKEPEAKDVKEKVILDFDEDKPHYQIRMRDVKRQ